MEAFVRNFSLEVETRIITPYNVGSVLWRLFSTSGDNISTVGDSFSTVEVVQYSGGIASVLWGDNISTCGGITSVLWGITSVLRRVFSTVEG